MRLYFLTRFWEYHYYSKAPRSLISIFESIGKVSNISSTKSFSTNQNKNGSIRRSNAEDYYLEIPDILCHKNPQKSRKVHVFHGGQLHNHKNTRPLLIIVFPP